jgi:hypothetical protein
VSDDKPAQEIYTEKITLWTDHSWDHGYRPTLELIVRNGKPSSLRLNVHGHVVELPYTFPYAREDRL